MGGIVDSIQENPLLFGALALGGAGFAGVGPLAGMLGEGGAVAAGTAEGLGLAEGLGGAGIEGGLSFGQVLNPAVSSGAISTIPTQISNSIGGFGLTDAIQGMNQFGGQPQEQQQQQQPQFVPPPISQGGQPAAQFSQLAPQVSGGFRPSPTSAIFDDLQNRGFA